MTIITDDMVEKAAKGICDAWAAGMPQRLRVNWEDQAEQTMELCRRDARAALEVVLSDIVDACADVAWREDSGGEAAQAIRDLIPSNQEAEG